jgi:hypothetical protein
MKAEHCTQPRVGCRGTGESQQPRHSVRGLMICEGMGGGSLDRPVRIAQERKQMGRRVGLERVVTVLGA